MLIVFIDYIVPASVLLPIITFATRKARFPPALKVLALYLLLSSLINLAGIIMAANESSNLWLLHFYTVVEAISFLLFFRQINNAGNTRTLIEILIVVFPLVCIGNSLFVQTADKFNTFSRSAEAIIFISLSVQYWLRHNEDIHQTWLQNPYNWIASGILIYFSSCFFLFIFSNILLSAANAHADVRRAISIVWIIHGSLVMVQYILFSIGFSKYARKL